MVSPTSDSTCVASVLASNSLAKSRRAGGADEAAPFPAGGEAGGGSSGNVEPAAAEAGLVGSDIGSLGGTKFDGICDLAASAPAAKNAAASFDTWATALRSVAGWALSGAGGETAGMGGKGKASPRVSNDG